MRGLFCGTTAKTNEEFKKVIRHRMKLMSLLVVFGIITALSGIIAGDYLKVNISDRLVGEYTGIGTGLAIAGVIMLIKNKILLNDEEKLKQTRLSNTDERVKEISNKAFRTAAYLMIITVYLIAIIGGIFYPVLTAALMFCVCVFLLAYIIAFKYYNNRM